MKIKLPYGNKFVETGIPEDNLVAFAPPQEVIGISDAEAKIIRTVNNPIGMRKIEKIVKAENNVALLKTWH